MRQTDLFATNLTTTPVAQTPDPDEIRVRLHTVLQQLREADEMPWPPAQARSWKHVFHNMANWLPAEERDRLRRDFTAEVERLERS